MLVATIFLALFLIISLARPVWAISLILALLPTYLIRFDIHKLPTTFLEMMVGLFLLGVVLNNLNPDSWKKIKGLGNINFAVLAFVLAGIISIFISPEMSRAAGQFKAFILEPILFFYGTILVLNYKNIKTPLKFLFLSVSLISLFGIFQYWTHFLLPLRFWGYGLEVKRITSIFEYPNALALYIAPLFIFFLSLYINRFEFTKKYWNILGLLAMCFAIVLTYSRGAWIAVAVGLLILSLRLTGLSLRKWGSAAAILVLILSPLLAARLKLSFHDSSSNERLGLYKAAGEKLSGNPIFGNGLYGFRTTLEHSDYQGEILNYPHNIILNFWLETGLLGVLSFALIIFLAMRKYKTNPTNLRFAAAMYVIVMFTHGMVDVPYFKNDLAILFWFAIALFYISEDAQLAKS